MVQGRPYSWRLRAWGLGQMELSPGLWAPPLSGCLAVGSTLSLSGPQFPHL